MIALALGLVGCGTSVLAGDVIGGRTLTIYTGMPLQGASAAGARQVLDGEQLALGQVNGRIGRYSVALKALDDASAQSARWDAGQTSLNAHLSAQDPTTIGYIGDFNSGASAVAIPVLNRAGILQVTPTSTAVGLTSNGPGAAPGEPGKYYPSGQRTFIALAPDDAVEATVQVRLQRRLGCSHTVVLYDGEFDGYAAAASFELVAGSGGLSLTEVQGFAPHALDYTSLALSVAQSRADCIVFSALPDSGVALLAAEVGAALPHAKLFATDMLAQPDFISARHGGLPSNLDSRVLITAPVADSDRVARVFTAAFQARFGDPDAYAAYGYEAMRFMLAAIARATHGGTRTARRSEVLAALFSRSERKSPLGAYRVRRDGTTTLSAYGIYRVVHGRLVLWQTIAAPRR